MGSIENKLFRELEVVRMIGMMGEYLKMFSWVSHLYQESIRIKFTMFCSLGSVA